jgi:hypothetical protein
MESPRLDMSAAAASGGPLERRTQRSDRPEHALAYLLEATRRGQGLRSIALADGSGLLVAGAGSARDCDELAAWAPLLLGDADAASEEGAPVSGIRVQGFDAILCAERDRSAAEPELAMVAAGCRRILRSRAA